MSDNCQLVVFSNKAYNAIIRESFDKDPVETGGILLGHVLDNGVWIVMEVLPPGINSIFQYAYFEYDEAFVNYLAQSVANQYKRPLDLLGLWHRHPGGMDVFSTTDDGTNLTFARQNPAGVISGLVNIDPRFRLTMYHLDCPTHRPLGRPDYSVVKVEVGDDIIPEEYFELRYFDGNEANLHPMVAVRGRERNINRNMRDDRRDRRTVNPNFEEDAGEENPDGLDVQAAINRGLPPCDVPRNDTPNIVNDFFHFWRASKKKWLLIFSAIIVLILGAFIFRSCKDNIEKTTSWIKELVHKDKTSNNPQLSENSINLTIGESAQTLHVENAGDKKIKWESENPSVAIVNKEGVVTPLAVGKTIIKVYANDKLIGGCNVIVTDKNQEATVKEGGENEVSEGNDRSGNASPDTVSFVLNLSSGKVEAGKSFLLDITKTGEPVLTYQSSDTNIATVDGNGAVTGISKGEAKITITQEGKDPVVYNLTVN